MKINKYIALLNRDLFYNNSESFMKKMKYISFYGNKQLELDLVRAIVQDVINRYRYEHRSPRSR